MSATCRSALHLILPCGKALILVENYPQNGRFWQICTFIVPIFHKSLVINTHHFLYRKVRRPNKTFFEDSPKTPNRLAYLESVGRVVSSHQTEHLPLLKNIYGDGELVQVASVNNYLPVQPQRLNHFDNTPAYICTGLLNIFSHEN